MDSSVSYALEKIGDFIRGSGSGKAVPGWSDTATKVIIESLRGYKERLLEHNISPDECEHEVGTAIYAICELQAFITGDKTDIANRKAAAVYLGFLAARMAELDRR